MSASSVSSKHFTNPYADYSVESATNVLAGSELHPNSKIKTCLNAKWNDALRKFDDLEFRDYSVYTGTAGIALLKLLKNPNDTSNLQDMKELLRLHKLNGKRHTFLCGDAGSLAIGAVVSHKLRESEQLKKLVNQLMSMQEDATNYKSDLPNEYLYGRAGYLFALLYINKHVQPPPIEESVIRKIIEVMLLCGQNESKAGNFKCPLMYQWHDSYYLGAAHGVSGIIYLLLQAKKYLTETELDQLIRPTIDYLITLRYQSGNYPSSLGSKNDKYVQWCHGAPGFVYMFSIAYKVFKDPKYLQLALESGDVVWQRGLIHKGYSICHGVSGNAYCFLELYQTTKDIKHLYRALKFAEWCVDYNKSHEHYPPDRPLSLYEGIAGPMYFLLDIQNPMEAKFPGFTL